ncbi:MAG: Flp family type IVb pilin [Candidatus Sericytochromatia bacterium]
MTLIEHEDGQGMAEYGVILAIVSVSAISTITALGTEIKTSWQNTIDTIQAAM